jgi:hypothetical protein
MTDTREVPIESLVVADFGRGTSRAYLLEAISGAFRFVAKAEHRTTTDLPYEDLSQGWYALLRQLEWASGRGLTVRDRLAVPQLASGDGVDGLLISASLGEPIRIAILEAGQSAVAGPVLDALRRVHTRVFHAAAPSSRKDGGWAATQADALRSFQPEMALLIVGAGAQDAMPRLLQLAKQIGVIGTVSRAIVIADGQAQEQGVAALGSKLKVRSISPVVRAPADIAQEIERELGEAFQIRLRTSDFDDIAEDAMQAPISRAHAVDLVNRFIARAFKRQVLTIGIDDGTHVHWAAGDQGAISALPQVDLATSMSGLTSRDVADATCWLPFEISEDELITWALNRSIRPWTIAEQPRDLAIEQAMARQVARRAIAEISRAQPMALSGVDLVIGGPAFARWNQPGAAALALLDSLDVVPNNGVVDLALDPDGLMSVAGIVGTIDPNLASSLFEYDALTHLGSAIVIGGATSPGDVACRGELHFDSGEMAQFSVLSGTVEVIPLSTGETATIVLRPERKFSVGGHPAGKTVTLAEERRIIGGTVGVIIDARPRSLATNGNRAAQVRQWFETVNGIRGTTAVRKTAG